MSRAETSNDSSVEKLGDRPKSSSDDTDPEQRLSDKESESNSAAELKRDSNGLPLVPQPSRFKDDPLVSLLISSNISIKIFPHNQSK